MNAPSTGWMPISLNLSNEEEGRQPTALLTDEEVLPAKSTVLTNSRSAIEANFECLQSCDEVTENATNAVRSLTIP